MALYMRTNGVTKKVGTSSLSAIPASNSTYDNTQSGLQADNVQNAIDEINSNLVGKTANNIDNNTQINITSEYTFLHDGLLTVISSGTGYFTLRGSSSGYLEESILSTQKFVISVRKGMKIIETGTPNTVSAYIAYLY